MTAISLTQEYLKSILNYNPETGIFTWLVRVNSKVPAGQIAGSISDQGYLKIGINGKIYRASHLACLYMTGKFPEECVDHINHNTLDDRWGNLRMVTKSINQRNKSLGKNNTSGRIGVYWDKSRDRWCAEIHLDNKKKHLGRFKKLEDAIKAREKAESRNDFHENHGAIPS